MEDGSETPRRRSDHPVALLSVPASGGAPGYRVWAVGGGGEGKPGPLLWGAAAGRALPIRRRQGLPSAGPAADSGARVIWPCSDSCGLQRSDQLLNLGLGGRGGTPVLVA